MSPASPVAIVTDSTSDVPLAEVRRHGITVIPALITVAGDTHADSPEFDRRGLYQRMHLLGTLPTTAAPSPAAFESVYTRLLNEGHEHIISVHVSGSLSSIFDIATQVAQRFNDRVSTFDSRSVSLGLGFQVVEAAAAAALGQSAGAILGAAARLRDRVRVIAMVNSLESLHHSGRVGSLAANLGDWLNIKLLVEVVDGIVRQFARVRTRHRALDEMESKAVSWSHLARLAVLHAAVPHEAAQFAERLRPVHSQPWVVEATTVIGTHVGQGSIGLAAVLV
jgi:DegV family protein with EDD domain